MDNGGRFGREPTSEPSHAEQRGGVLATDVPGHVVAAFPLELRDETTALGHDHGRVPPSH